MNAAKNIMFSSAQKLQLTELSGRRDMSLLLAQSAVQVSVMHIQLDINPGSWCPSTLCEMIQW